MLCATNNAVYVAVFEARSENSSKESSSGDLETDGVVAVDGVNIDKTLI